MNINGHIGEYLNYNPIYKYNCKCNYCKEYYNKNKRWIELTNKRRNTYIKNINDKLDDYYPKSEC